jgi:hypothetical protein
LTATSTILSIRETMCAPATYSKGMAAPQTNFGSDVLTLESCEDGLGFLAYALREDLAEGRTTSGVELSEIRGVALELLGHASRLLLELWSSSSETTQALVDLKLSRLLRALRTLHPTTSRREFADGLQSAADLIRSSRQLERQHVNRRLN